MTLSSLNANNQITVLKYIKNRKKKLKLFRYILSINLLQTDLFICVFRPIKKLYIKKCGATDRIFRFQASSIIHLLIIGSLKSTSHHHCKATSLRRRDFATDGRWKLTRFDNPWCHGPMYHRYVFFIDDCVDQIARQ